MPPSFATPLSSLTARELYGVRAQTPAGVVPFGLGSLIQVIQAYLGTSDEVGISAALHVGARHLATAGEVRR